MKDAAGCLVFGHSSFVVGFLLVAAGVIGKHDGQRNYRS
jgi:hypothetical protein